MTKSKHLSSIIATASLVLLLGSCKDDNLEKNFTTEVNENAIAKKIEDIERKQFQDIQANRFNLDKIDMALIETEMKNVKNRSEALDLLKRAGMKDAEVLMNHVDQKKEIAREEFLKNPEYSNLTLAEKKAKLSSIQAKVAIIPTKK